jgi:hypothetical protein
MKQLRFILATVSRSTALRTGTAVACLAVCQGCAYFAPREPDPTQAFMEPPPGGYVGNGALAEAVGAGLSRLVNGK